MKSSLILPFLAIIVFTVDIPSGQAATTSEAAPMIHIYEWKNQNCSGPPELIRIEKPLIPTCSSRTDLSCGALTKKVTCKALGDDNLYQTIFCGGYLPDSDLTRGATFVNISKYYFREQVCRTGSPSSGYSSYYKCNIGNFTEGNSTVSRFVSVNEYQCMDSQCQSCPLFQTFSTLDCVIPNDTSGGGQSSSTVYSSQSALTLAEASCDPNAATNLEAASNVVLLLMAAALVATS